MVTIAKRQFIKHTKNTKLDLQEAFEYKLSPKGQAVARTYEGYWGDKKDPPRLYVAAIPPKSQ